jgi:hypothetical protein
MLIKAETEERGREVVGIASCQKASIEGTCNMENGPIKGVVATFGPTSYTLSSGATGTYEWSDDQVILSGSGVSGPYKVDGNTLTGPTVRFVKRSADDKSPIYQGPRKGYDRPAYTE